uniref:MORN repeat-containing protein n=1 Tax=Trepomonas sp. PC1 TaxID=1076344 RepID=A0A146KKG9_9EUKA|eukprot:JAP95739.1 hypothetical protein TPC1_11163 [Trepomonas sp. PC1]
MPPKQVQQLNGIFTYPNGDYYKGDYTQENEQQYRQGAGTYICFSEESLGLEEIPVDVRTMPIPQRYPNDIIKLTGQWNHDGFVEGEICFANGAKYSGKLDGVNYVSGGTYTFPDGKQYTGEFFNNMLHGIGTVKAGDMTFGPGVYKNNYGDGL